MSWLCRDSEFGEDDWRLLTFTWGKSAVFTISKPLGYISTPGPASEAQVGRCHSRRLLRSEAEWDSWLAEEPAALADGINLVLAGRTSELSVLPFSSRILSAIKSRLHIHKSIFRAVNRNASCTFSKFPFEWKHGNSKRSSIVYTCRTAALWDDDAALSVTFFPETLATSAVWYGCNFERKDIHGHTVSDYDIITGRLANSDCAVFHPMLLPTIFADFERERQIPLVRRHLRKLVQKLFDLSEPQSQQGQIKSSGSCAGIERPSYGAHWPQSLLGALSRILPGKRRPEMDANNTATMAGDELAPLAPAPSTHQDSSVRLWLEISDLRNGLENWRAQLVKMRSHVEELEKTYFCMDSGTTEETKAKSEALRDCGERIKERLQDLVDEYDEFIRDCVLTMDGMTLATQLELNKIGRDDALINQEISTINLKVATRARHDGYVMRSIAVLGMLFLPGTFVSAFFSMGLFRWIKEDDSRTVSPFIWAYVSVTLVVTSLTFAVFYMCTSRKRHGTAQPGYYETV